MTTNRIHIRHFVAPSDDIELSANPTAHNATSGKKFRKKDLGMIAKSYGYVYVAQVAMGASQAQYFCQRLRTPLNISNAVNNAKLRYEGYKKLSEM